MANILGSLRRHPGGICGYDIRKETGENAPTIYKILTRLASLGWVDVRREPSLHRGSPDRNIHILNVQGREAAEEYLTAAGQLTTEGSG